MAAFWEDKHPMTPQSGVVCRSPHTAESLRDPHPWAAQSSTPPGREHLPCRNTRPMGGCQPMADRLQATGSAPAVYKPVAFFMVVARGIGSAADG